MEKLSFRQIHYLAIVLSSGLGFSQPVPAPATGDAPCAPAPSAALTGSDTVESTRDGEGYLSLMDGTSFKGWWQSCETGHSGGNPKGGIFRVSPEQKAFYLTQRDGRDGGILMTKKKFNNYELVFDWWSDYGNDGGIFHRTPPNGRCVQTVLDYIGEASVGGVWGEGGIRPGRDLRPWSYAGSEAKIKIPGNGQGELSNWTTITSKLNPTLYGCAASGCTEADYLRLFDADGWNQIKIQFYGAQTKGNPVKVKTWFRKMGAEKWVPILMDTATYLLDADYGPNYIGIQVHGGSRFGGPKGAWFRNMKWRELTATGEYAWPSPTSLYMIKREKRNLLSSVSNSNGRATALLLNKSGLLLVNGRKVDSKSISISRFFDSEIDFQVSTENRK